MSADQNPPFRLREASNARPRPVGASVRCAGRSRSQDRLLTPTLIGTDDPAFEAATHRLGCHPLGCGLGHDPCLVFRFERRLRKRPRQETFAAHAYAGLTVLGLVVIRLFLRTLLPWPKEEGVGSRIPKLVAEAMHWTLYALMVLTPLTGWIVASEMGCCMAVPGLPNIDRLGSGLSIGAPISATMAYHVHVFFVWTLLALISLHVLAALFHHFVVRDTILISMIPVLGKRAGATSASRAISNSQTLSTE
jgi:superoxide oxidase